MLKTLGITIGACFLVQLLCYRTVCIDDVLVMIANDGDHYDD